MAAVGVAVFAYLYLNRETATKTDESDAVATESKIVLERIYESPKAASSQTPLTGNSSQATPSKSNTGTSGTATSATATPTPGIFDYTQEKVEPLDETATEIIDRAIQQAEGKDSCQLANISDSWSNPVEKSVCGIIKFTEKNIMLPMMEFSCYMYAGAMNINYDTKINVRYEDNKCMVEDR